MKNILLLVLIFCVSMTQAQVYTKKNLEKCSIEDLNYYLQKAKEHRTEGYILLGIGPTASVVGVLLMKDNYHQPRVISGHHKDNPNLFLAGSFLFLGGVCATLVSVPIIVSNSIKYGKVKNFIINNRVAEIYISPGIQSNYISPNFNPALSLSIRF